MPSPITIGTPTNISATSTCGTGATAEYQFLIRREGTTETTVLRDWSESGAVELATEALPTSIYHITTNLRRAGAETASSSSVLKLKVGGTCGTATLSSPVRLGVPGTPVQLTAGSTCTGGSTAEYRFLVRKPGETVYGHATEWGPTTSHTFQTSDSTEAPLGNYAFSVESRAVGLSAANARAYIYYSLKSVCATGLTFAASPENAPVGTPIALSSSVTCDNELAVPEYRFSYRAPGSSTFTVVADWGAATQDLATQGLTPGAYAMKVESRAAGMMRAQATKTLTYMLGGRCTAAVLSTSPASPAAYGETVTLSGAATCSAGAATQYRFSMRAPGATTEVELQPWSETASYAWSTAGQPGGTYTLYVRARAHSNGTPVVATRSFAVGKPCTSVTAGISPSGTQPSGTLVTVSAAAKCMASGAAEYRFSQRLVGSETWTVFRDWSTETFAARDTVGADPGSYEVLIETRGLGYTGAAQGSTKLTHALGQACESGLTPNGAGSCASLETCAQPFTAQGSLRGGSVPFANGEELPAGTYTLSFVDGCMRYNGVSTWTVHAAADGANGWVVIDADSETVEVAPGTVGTTNTNGAYATPTECVNANKPLAPITFEHEGGPLSLKLIDETYADNSGYSTKVPTFKLTQECPVPETCDDAIQNQDESDVDCGGVCPACQNGDDCGVSTDCESEYCSIQHVCEPAPTCTDGIENQDETDLDCGGSVCPACENGGGCFEATDCVSAYCSVSGTCATAPTCTDGTMNGTETGVDCGGSCGACPSLFNGDFEQGLAGWSYSEMSSPYQPLTGSYQGWNGTNVVHHGFDGSPGQIALWQDATIGGSTLAFDYYGSYSVSSSQPRSFYVVIEPMGGGAVLSQTLVLSVLGSGSLGPTSGFVNVSAFVGQAVRVKFLWIVPENFTGPADFSIDNVRFQ